MKIYEDPEMIDFINVLDFGFTVVRGAALGLIVGAVVAAVSWFWS
jgi:hypothetical protein